jgi:hypothetical protein
MRDASTVIIQLLYIVTSRMLYSSHGGVKDFSGFFDLRLLYLRTVAPLHREGIAETL